MVIRIVGSQEQHVSVREPISAAVSWRSAGIYDDEGQGEYVATGLAVPICGRGRASLPHLSRNAAPEDRVPHTAVVVTVIIAVTAFCGCSLRREGRSAASPHAVKSKKIASEQVNYQCTRNLDVPET